MSFIAKRGLSTLIPPKIASPANLGSAPNAKRMANVVQFYKSLPQGTHTPAKATTPMGKYAQKYFSTNSSRPLLHLIAFLFLLGYSTDYYFHLRHHK